MLQYHPRGTSNNMISGHTDPKTTIPWYKGIRVAVRKAAGIISSVVATTSTREHNEFCGRRCTPLKPSDRA